MNVLAHVHMYPPHHNAGAEYMLHSLLRDLTSRGHNTRVLAAQSPDPHYTHQSIPVHDAHSTPIADHYDWADVAITHLDQTRHAMVYAHRHRVPLVHLVHNDRQLHFHRVTQLAAQLVIFNSSWIAQKTRWAGPSIIIRPPVFTDDYATTPGDAITLINLSSAKGARVFYQLALKLPDYPFLGVKGAYSQQIIPRHVPPNITIIDNTPDMRSVYSRTKILLMPSGYESWGRVGIEAAASGIPTIAHPTLGLKESLSHAGIFVERRNIAGWIRAIRQVERDYSTYSARALQRSDELNPKPDLDLFESELLKLIP